MSREMPPRPSLSTTSSHSWYWSCRSSVRFSSTWTRGAPKGGCPGQKLGLRTGHTGCACGYFDALWLFQCKLTVSLRDIPRHDAYLSGDDVHRTPVIAQHLQTNGVAVVAAPEHHRLQARRRIALQVSSGSQQRANGVRPLTVGSCGRMNVVIAEWLLQPLAVSSEKGWCRPRSRHECLDVESAGQWSPDMPRRRCSNRMFLGYLVRQNLSSVPLPAAYIPRAPTIHPASSVPRMSSCNAPDAIHADV